MHIYVLVFIIIITANKGLKELDQRLSNGVKKREFICGSKILMCEKKQILVLKLGWFREESGLDGIQGIDDIYSSWNWRWLSKSQVYVEERSHKIEARGSQV